MIDNTKVFIIAHLEGNGIYLYDKCIKIIEETKNRIDNFSSYFPSENEEFRHIRNDNISQEITSVNYIINKYSTELKKQVSIIFMI
jgi:hypothetical protein